jgi:serine phosphatase RsbU (regulator of sigma subunit)
MDKHQTPWPELILIMGALFGFFKGAAFVWDWLTGKKKKIEDDAIAIALKDHSLHDIAEKYKAQNERIHRLEEEQQWQKHELSNLKDMQRDFLQEIIQLSKHK